ncbi:hypothetical protein L0Z42_29830 (plasmid) [Burkholderia multivorans]|uniref:hypothetical protein n=1 Tax=Burkholderia multivorans TaxID=87883 RepID=UPI002018E94D|nr:hypothetical protein [Burkholderia multivorans]MCO1374683.1 hypothetical protein [Burkholderia multivorans]MCO1459998.1 hypothetical protein [Burkholderia multivorans]MCO1470780.1 hypothetical protein [Burkholderia multivorans]UQO21368.1 hypothetical protein L0Z02_29785 [Burkholderia multivorans]UQO87508.1 hypothetical protein L0Y86_29515 [Burkholderia multivorans]
MDANTKKGAKEAGIEIAKWLFVPGYALVKNFRALKAAKQQHSENIVYIKDLISAAKKQKARAEQAEHEQGFEEMMRSRSAGAPSVAELERRFLFQKRLAVGTGAVFLLMACYTIARGNVLGIFTLAGLPVMFMASLSAQLRLWQLRNRRLSRAERGGLNDFMQEPSWFWSVLNPELGKQQKGERA